MALTKEQEQWVPFYIARAERIVDLKNEQADLDPSTEGFDRRKLANKGLYSSYIDLVFLGQKDEANRIIEKLTRGRSPAAESTTIVSLKPGT